MVVLELMTVVGGHRCGCQHLYIDVWIFAIKAMVPLVGLVVLGPHADLEVGAEVDHDAVELKRCFLYGGLVLVGPYLRGGVVFLDRHCSFPLAGATIVTEFDMANGPGTAEKDFHLFDLLQV